MSTSIKNRRRPLLLLAVLATMILVIGCSEDDDPAQPEPTAYAFPDDPDVLMENFAAAYSGMDLSGVAQCLHSNYEFHFSAFDIDRNEFPTEPLDRDTEVLVSTHMFAGEPYESAANGTQAEILSINFEQFERIGDWQDATDDPIFPAATSRALFQLDLTFIRDATQPQWPIVIFVNTQQEFFVVRRDSLQSGGATRDYWQLVGQREFTSPELGKTETTTWGQLKNRYR